METRELMCRLSQATPNYHSKARTIMIIGGYSPYLRDEYYRWKALITIAYELGVNFSYHPWDYHRVRRVNNGSTR